jgi:hypothetical protein
VGKFYEGLGEELSLYVRFLAWLGSAPQEPAKKQLSGEKQSEPVSRIARMEADGVVPVLPPNSAPHLVQYLMEMGPVESTGMENGPISWGEMTDWCERTGVDLMPWQAKLIRRLSIDYLGEMRRAREPDCPAPWGGMTADRRATVEAKLRAAFGGMAQR